MDVFKSGEKSSFAKKSRSMARILAIGATSLAIVFCLFIYFYFSSNLFIRVLATILPTTYLFAYVLSFTKTTNKKLYDIIFLVFIFSSLSILYIAYQFSFNSEYIILMLVIYNIILIALPTPKQVLIYFLIIFIPLTIVLLSSSISVGFYLLITVSFGYVFAMSYVVSVQKKKLNQRNQKNAEILKTLVNNTNDSIFLVDFISKQIYDANEKSNEVFGVENEKEFLSKKYYELFADENFVPSNRSEITREITQYGYYHNEVLFKRGDGSEFWGNLLLSPFTAAKSNFYLIQIKNIDGKKKYDDRVFADKEKFKFILNNLDEFIYLVSYNENNDQKFEYISPYIEQLFGITKEEYISPKTKGKISEVYHPDDLPQLKLLKEELLKSKAKVSTTYRIKPIGKTDYISLHETVIPKLNEAGEIEQILGIIRAV